MAVWDDVIDFDNVGNWPMELTNWLRLLDRSADYGQGVLVGERVRENLQRSRLRPSVCTRLLPSEVETIRRDGLRPASSELACGKREAASAAGKPLPIWAQDDPSGKIWFY